MGKRDEHKILVVGLPPGSSSSDLTKLVGNKWPILEGGTVCVRVTDRVARDIATRESTGP